MQTNISQHFFFNFYLILILIYFFNIRQKNKVTFQVKGNVTPYGAPVKPCMT